MKMATPEMNRTEDRAAAENSRAGGSSGLTMFLDKHRESRERLPLCIPNIISAFNFPFLYREALNKDSLAQRRTKKLSHKASLHEYNCSQTVISLPMVKTIMNKNVTEAVSFDHDELREEIIKLLLNKQGSSNHCQVVGVIGKRGAGKTTLAQNIYDDERVKKHFDIRILIRLSQNFDINRVTKEMIEQASKKECPNLRNLNVLQNKLLQALAKSKNVMILLDNVCFDDNDKATDEQQWSSLLAPFTLGKVPCKIMVTSRSTLFPSALLPGKLINLSGLTNQKEYSEYSI